MVQHMQINRCDTEYRQKQGQKLHDHLSQCRKSSFQNSISFPDKSSDETRNTRKVPQHDKVTYDKAIDNIIINGKN
jgi:hypothetical protein